MKNIFLSHPENAVNYLAPHSLKRLLITMGVKLVLAAAGMLAMPVGEYSGLSRAILMLLLFAFVYDVCSLYQVCLHIAQSILMSFCLFLVLIFAVGFLFQYGAAFFTGAAPSTAAGENLLLGVMALIFLIPFIIDAVRLAKMLYARRSTASPPNPS